MTRFEIDVENGGLGSFLIGLLIYAIDHICEPARVLFGAEKIQGEKP